jgi:predicted nucleotidyltransferase
MIVPAEGDGAEARAVLDMDIVSHDVRKFFKLLLKNNGYVLEQLFSPLGTSINLVLNLACCLGWN